MVFLQLCYLALLEHLSLIPCSLDIEGSEEGVLETIPWQQVISGFCLLMVIKYPMDVGHYILSTNLRTIWNLNEINKERCFKLQPYQIFPYFCLQVDIRVLQVEYLHSNKTNILRIMDAAGYDNLTPKLNLKTDFIFVKRGQNIM